MNETSGDISLLGKQESSRTASGPQLSMHVKVGRNEINTLMIKEIVKSLGLPLVMILEPKQIKKH